MIGSGRWRSPHANNAALPVDRCRFSGLTGNRPDGAIGDHGYQQHHGRTLKSSAKNRGNLRLDSLPSGPAPGYRWLDPKEAVAYWNYL